jgi:radical SAM protein with 4Fe4S-binding SPASM domain
MRVNSLQNRLALGKSYLQKSEISGGLPVYVVVESTSICNLKCIMCPYPNMGRKNEHMAMTVYEKIVTEGAGFIEFMWLHLFGEPLINKSIYRMIDMAEKAGIRTGISTNATLMDEKAASAILDSRLSLLILCLDGATKETFEKIRVGARFERVVANIARFSEIKRKRQSDLRVVLQMIDMTANDSEKQLFYSTWRNKGFDSVVCKDFHVWANQDESLIQIEQLQPRTSSGLCYEPWIGFTILADGTVVPCCNDYDGKLVLGDLKSQSLREIWNGEAMRNLRRRFLKETPDLVGTICQDCPYVTATPVDAQTGAGPFDPIQQEFGVYLRGADEMPRLHPADPHVVDITLRPASQHVSAGEAFACEVTLSNRTTETLRSVGDTAVHLSYHWIGTDGTSVVHDGERSRLIPDLPSGQTRTYDVLVVAPNQPGTYSLTVTPVQEQVVWFDIWDPRNAATCRITVSDVDKATVSSKASSVAN